MTSKTPKFWYKKNSFLSKLLSPLSCFYKAGDAINKSGKTPKGSNIPIICVGNLNIGGAGKTPTCIALSKILTEHNDFIEPIFLTRGYGGNILGPEFVDHSNSAQIWGDEPLLLSQYARTIVSQNRVLGAQLAEQSDADIVIMDDGFQNNRIKKDISIIVADGTYGFGNQRIIPAGPLRETLEVGLDRADAFIIVGEDTYGLKDIIPDDKPTFSAKTKVRSGWKADKKKDYIAFCGIAHPGKFEQTLKDKGLEVKELMAFPDHHFFSPRDIKKLFKKAEKLGATLITTEKDHVRIPAGNNKEEILTLPIETHFTAKEKKALLKFITSRLEDKNR